MTCIDKNRAIFPSEVWETSQQKRHSTKSALKNGGAAIFDGVRVLRPPSVVSLFIRQLTGKKQALDSLSIGFGSHVDICAPVKEIAAEISANSLRIETGKEQGK